MHAMPLAMALAMLLAVTAEARVVRRMLDAAGVEGVPYTASSVHGLVTDAAGNAYVASNRSSDEAVFRIGTDGTTSVLIRANDIGDGVLHRLGGVAVDAAGTVYASGAHSSDVYRRSPAGTLTKVFDGLALGAQCESAGGGRDACRLAVGPDGTLFVGASSARKVFRVDVAGTVTLLIDQTGDGAGHGLQRLGGMTVGTDGSLYVVSGDTDTLFRIAPNGGISVAVGAAGDGLGHDLDWPIDVAVAPDGTVLVSGRYSQNILRYDPSTETVSQVISLEDVPWLAAANWWSPELIDVDPAGNVVFGVTGQPSPPGFLVLRLTPDGRLSTVMDDRADGNRPTAELVGLATTTTGSIFVANEQHYADTEAGVFRIDLRCPEAPRTSCGTSTRAGAGSLQVKAYGPLPNGRDRFLWKWARGSATALADFGDVLGGDDVAVCIYDGAGVLRMDLGAGGGTTCLDKACWRAKGATGLGYNWKHRAPDGLESLVLKSGAAGKSSIVARGSGTPLVLPAAGLPFDLPVRVHLVAATGACWESHFGTAQLNGPSAFQAKSD